MADSILPTKALCLRIVKKGNFPLHMGQITTAIEKFQDAGPVLWTNMEIEESDITLPVVALDDKRILYSFGKNFGKLSVSGVIFLFNCKNVSAAARQIKDAFDKERVSKKLSPINFSGLKLSAKVYVTEFEINSADPRTQTIMFSIGCIVAPVSNRG